MVLVACWESQAERDLCIASRRQAYRELGDSQSWRHIALSGFGVAYTLPSHRWPRRCN